MGDHQQSKTAVHHWWEACHCACGCHLDGVPSPALGLKGVRNKHKGRCKICTFITIIIPNMEMPLVLLKLINKSMSVFMSSCSCLSIYIPFCFFPYCHSSSTSQQCAVHSEMDGLSIPKSQNQTCISGLEMILIKTVTSR